MSQSPNSDTTTEGIRVRAAARFVPEQSDPDSHHYLFAYRIEIENTGDRTAKLLSRHWVILDADNGREDVRGPGVVGEFPELSPGERYEYVSGCPLTTSWGTMEGTYRFERDDGDEFDVHVGRFFLVSTITELPPASGVT